MSQELDVRFPWKVVLIGAAGLIVGILILTKAASEDEQVLVSRTEMFETVSQGGVTRIVDKELGNVCYLYGKGRYERISCVGSKGEGK